VVAGDAIYASDGYGPTVFGSASDGVGDLNGDGFDEVIAGAPRDSFQPGAAYLYFGSASGLDQTTEVIIRPSSLVTFQGFGAAIAGVGDVNDDGFPDALIGEQEIVGFGADDDTGIAWLFLGDGSGLDLAAPETLGSPTSETTDYFAAEVAALDDTDGDGIPDFAISANTSADRASKAGLVWLFHGTSTGSVLASPDKVSASDAAVGDRFGLGLAGVGDVDGDGFNDMAVGAPQRTSQQGIVFLYYGSAAGMGRETKITAPSPGSGDSYGNYIDGAGDVDGDGLDDLVIAAWADDYNPTGVPADNVGDTGALYVLYGQTGGVDTSRQDVIRASDVDSAWFLGHRGVRGVGDVDADGFSDVLAGSYGDDTNGDNAGSAWLFFGSAAGLTLDSSHSKLLPFDGGGIGHQFGRGVGSAGDVNGDTVPDFMVSSWRANSPAYSGTGMVYMFSGTCTDNDSDSVCGNIDCNDDDEDIKPGVAEIPGDGVDQNCDGVEDCAEDGDGDGFGGSTVVIGNDLDCDDPGESLGTDDCDDGDLTVFPGATEVIGDGIDQDCDGVDEPCDQDGDGAERSECSGTDCDDSDAAISPSATEIWYDGVDQDCDGASDFDQDGDGEDSEADGSGADCDDTEASIYPGAPEIAADGIDQDCDGADTCDADGDGFDHPDCTDGDDCDDSEAGVNPDGVEVPYDGLDNDCAGGDECDVDGDGGIAVECAGDDCADSDADRFVGSDEVPYDGIDQDCDGSDDDDLDGDGWPGTPGLDDMDCDDADAGIHPAATDVANDGIDQDCTGLDFERWLQSGTCATASSSGGGWLLLPLLLLVRTRSRR